MKDLVYNLSWTWNHETISLFRRLDRNLWDETYHNPVDMLGQINHARLEDAINDDSFMSHLRRSHEDLQTYLTDTTWFGHRFGKTDGPQIAYFSMEFGLSECLPIYSGGLGMLAGDHLKSSSDLGIPLVGVGLLYQKGYFQQYLNADGWQQETYPENDFYNLPILPALDGDGQHLTIDVQMVGRKVYAQVWRAQVGRVSLYLLDTNTEKNESRDRKITYQLYGGDSETRIQQEIVLGIGGMRALRALGHHVKVCHMNEGHAALMALERMHHRMQKDHLSFDEALEATRAGTVFTTHTPVPAGIDTFDPGLLQRYLSDFFQESGLNPQSILGLGRRNALDQNEPVNMALLALRTTAMANGVSKLHGLVSRKMFQSIWPTVPLNEVPISYVTNGVHTRSWISSEMSDLFTRYLGPNWISKPGDQEIWEKIVNIPDIELWRIHERRRDRLVAFCRRHICMQLKRRLAPTKDISCAGDALNPEALTIGFARRFATYKRATLLLKDPGRLKQIITNSQRPVQFIFAGKAHPKDHQGKEFIRQLIQFARQAGVTNSFVFLENYDMNVARYLVQGVDVWLNNPRRPMEASGTSGMKVVHNGGLNFSILDGWWDEGYSSDCGWIVGQGEEYDDPAYQDEVESKSIYDTLENEIIPLFYQRTHDGLPRNWIAMMKNSMRKLSPQFNTNRMVSEYTEHFYVPLGKHWSTLAEEEFSKTRELVEWSNRVKASWGGVRIVSSSITKNYLKTGHEEEVEASINLNGLEPSDVAVQVYSGPLDGDHNIVDGQTTPMSSCGQSSDGNFLFKSKLKLFESGLHGYSVRILPSHSSLLNSSGLEMLKWIES